MEGVELEFAMDDQNILLLRYHDLPIADELLQVLAIYHKELLALLKTAEKLLAGTSPEDQMRAYAARDFERRMAGGAAASMTCSQLLQIQPARIERVAAVPCERQRKVPMP